jgi:hypothetical protein
MLWDYELYMQGFAGKPEAKSYLEEPRIKGRIILKWTLINTKRGRGAD